LRGAPLRSPWRRECLEPSDRGGDVRLVALAAVRARVGLEVTNPVVRRVDDALQVVRVALAIRHRGHPDELRSLPQLCDGLRSAVAHRLAEPAGELMYDLGERSAVGDVAFDTFGHDLFGVDIAPMLPMPR